MMKLVLLLASSLALSSLGGPSDGVQISGTVFGLTALNAQPNTQGDQLEIDTQGNEKIPLQIRTEKLPSLSRSPASVVPYKTTWIRELPYRLPLIPNTRVIISAP